MSLNSTGPNELAAAHERATRIHLVRHGTTLLNRQNRYRGRRDVALDQGGWDDAWSAASELQSLPLAAVYSSPLRRARDTARIVADVAGVDEVADLPGLTNLEYGAWEGLTSTEASTRDPELFQMYQHYDVAAACPDGERLRDAATRVILSLRLIGALHPGQEVAAVSHAAMVRLAITEAMGGPRAEWRRTLPNGSITVIDVFDDEVRIARTPESLGAPMSALVGNLRDAVPTRVRVPLRHSVRRVAQATSTRRPLPEFLIIGTKRGGTTTLFRSLQRHPLVLPMFPTVQRLKSPHYFDLEYHRGEAWYRSHFATRRARRMTEGGTPITGEASPYYLFHPLAPGRVSRVMPDARLIVLLRDPTARAFSHYWDRVKEGTEPLSFGEAVDREEARLAGREELLQRGTVATSAAHEHFSYVARGRYAEQLERWYARFPRQNVLVMRSEDLYTDPQWAYRRAVEFLGLPPAPRPAETKKLHGHADRPVIPAADEARLREYFAPHNRRLAALLDTEVWW